jgi:FkbM family methyltransferase
MDFLRFGLRDRILRFFHHPDLASAETFVLDFFGFKYPGTFECFLDWSVFYYGAYAKDELRVLEKLIKASKGTTILDIGANIGHHSLYFASFGKETHAFEPLGVLAKEIARKKQKNNLKLIHIHEIALGEKNQTMEFFPPSSNNTGTGSFVNVNFNTKPILIKVFNGDQYIAQKKIGDIGLIKIDVEGFEIQVLKGLKQTLSANRPIDFIECTQENSTALKEQSKIEKASGLFPGNYKFYSFFPAKPYLAIFSNQLPD